MLEREADVVGRVEDRVDLGDEGLGRLLEDDPREDVEPDAEAAAQPRSDEPLQAVAR